MAIDRYIDLSTSQHKTKPKFKAWLSSALSIVNDGMTATKLMPDNFDIDTAIGKQLDVLGEIIGRSRIVNFQPADGSSPVLDDEDYRLILKAKIAQNQWDGTIPQVYKTWRSLFPDMNLYVLDNQDMTMSALLDGQLDPIATELVTAGYIIPKSLGVGIKIIQVTDVPGMSYIGVLVNDSEIITITTSSPV